MKYADSVEGDTLKWEAEIFQDIIENLMSIVIAGYSFYLLSWTDEVGNQIRKIKVEEEEKKSQSDQNKPKIESDSKYDQLIVDYFKELEALPEGESCEKYWTEWSKKTETSNIYGLLSIDNWILKRELWQMTNF